jgi:hypothetical protein
MLYLTSKAGDCREMLIGLSRTYKLPTKTFLFFNQQSSFRAVQGMDVSRLLHQYAPGSGKLSKLTIPRVGLSQGHVPRVGLSQEWACPEMQG